LEGWRVGIGAILSGGCRITIVHNLINLQVLLKP
jgi:hypothetical protein